MEDLQGFRQFVQQKYPNMSKSQLSQLDSFVSEQQARGIAEKGVPLGEIQEDPVLRTIQFEQSQKEGFEIPRTKEEKQEAKGENIVDQLEKTFFGTEGQESLAFGKEGFGGRLPGVFKGIERAVSPGEPGSPTERLNTYIRTLESVRPQLAKMAGDSGNIAFAEQLQAGKGLPQATDTPTEAIEIMQSAREKFGLERSPELDRLKEEILSEGGIEERAVAEKAVSPLEGITPEETKSLADRGFLESLVSTKATREYIGAWPEILLDSVVDTGKNIVDVVRGDWDSLKERGEEAKTEFQMIKELDKAAKEEISTKIETITGISAIKSFLGKNLSSKLSGVKPQDAKAVLQEGMSMVQNGQSIRNAGIEQAQSIGKKVNGTKVFNMIQQLAGDAASLLKGSQKKEMLEFVNQANRKLNGKVLNPKNAKKLWDVADNGFTSAGKAGNTIEAAYHRAVRDSIRKELDSITGGAFEKGTALIREGLSKNRILKSLGSSLERQVAKKAIEGTPSPVGEFTKKIGKEALSTGAKGLGLYAVARALGLQFPGAAYPSE